MDLTPREQEKLLLFTAAEVSRRRLARGLALNVAEAMEIGTQVLGPDQVQEGVRDLLSLIQVEATFPDGTKLVSVHDPIGQ